MNTNEAKPQHYDYVYERIHSLSLIERLGIFALFFGNGVIFWHLPGVLGLVVGGLILAFVCVLVLGEVWRQLMGVL